MKVTLNLLNKYNSCTDGITWLQDNAPDGIEVLDALNNYKIPIDFILFGLRYFNLTEEERAAATDKLNIVNSTDIYQSYNIVDSHHIRISHDVSNSSNVWGSSNIKKCEKIVNTQYASDCTNIQASEDVKSSENIFNSKNISYSSDIYKSSSISWSVALINSLNIEDGYYLSLCENSILLTICEALKNCKNCCCCFSLESVENYLFNKPCSSDRINMIRSDLQSIILNAPAPKAETKLPTFFKDIPEAALNYIHNLPEYTIVPGASFM